MLNIISFAHMFSQQPSHSNQQRHRFKRWSRKGYAVFSSLGSVVHIGCLSVSLLQTISQMLLCIETVLDQSLKVDDEDDDVNLEENELMLITIVDANSASACEINKILI
ncbi:hypothetical protein [Carboxylicivirga sp. M1479]|uniref:hypothetical protein n=1 Tax=Carboxylicivirga sp. M1479 TaxID=2594476 RepID=UPI001177B330|nr:hypothetical protein [Carboxylicivirga sp. M1479]TRX64270.1 hypothetical protein FNN09_18085 [Carboxylicivirga sp. M1479]